MESAIRKHDVHARQPLPPLLLSLLLPPPLPLLLLLWAPLPLLLSPPPPLLLLQPLRPAACCRPRRRPGI